MEIEIRDSRAWAISIVGGGVDTLKRHVNRANVNVFYGTLQGSETMLGIAARLGLVTEARWLLENGANIYIYSNDGCSVLHGVIARAYHAIIPVVIKFCSAAKVDTPDQNGFSALDHALQRELFGVARALIRKGARLSQHHIIVRSHYPSDSLLGLCMVVDFYIYREKCRKAALLVVGIRRFNRSPVLASNGKDVAWLLGKCVWNLFQ